MTGSLRLRRGRRADADALARFERRAFRGYYAKHRFSEADFRRYLARPTTIAYVVEHTGEIAAYVLGVRGTASRRHVARLHSIAVDEAERGRGLGRRLVRAFLADARRHCRVAYLEVGASNASALALFAVHGFVRTRRLPAFYSATADAVRMRCEL